MNEWFDEWGYLVREIPKEAVRECIHVGDCDEDVKRWREKLNFNVPRELAIEYLAPYGGWTREELSEKTDENLSEIVLWIALGDIREYGEWAGCVH